MKRNEAAARCAAKFLPLCIALLGTVVYAWLAVGCGPRPAADPGTVGTLRPQIDLLDLRPPILGLTGEDPPRAPRRSWEFADRLPDEWTAGPEGVRVAPEPGGGIRLESNGSPPWLEIRTEIDPLLYSRFSAVLDPRSGRTAVLAYSFEDPPRYNPLSRTVSRLRPRQGERRYGFKLPEPHASETAVRALRFYPGGAGGSAVVKRLALVPRSMHYLRETMLGSALVELGQEYRRCWRLRGSGVREVAITVPATGAELRFATGTLIGSPSPRYRVLLRSGWRGFREIAAGPMGEPGEGWQEQRVPLSAWAGREVTLRFRVESDTLDTVSLIATPTVLGPDDSKRRNVLFVLVDTLRADSLSLYGHDKRTSPHLAHLAERGVLFSRATAPSSWTIPSVAAALTGRYPDRLRVGWGMGSKLPRSVPTLAERFAAEGYTTAGFVSNFVLAGSHGYARGFGTYYLAPYKDYQLTAGRLNRRVHRWLRAHRDERMFCYVHFMDPHNPYDAPLPGRETAGRREFSPAWKWGWRDGNVWPLVLGKERIGGPAELARFRGRYDDEVSYVDFEIGRLLAGFAREGLLDDMVVLVTADHGEEFRDHGYWSHGHTLYQEVVHVPLILSAPGLGERAGTVNHRPVSLVDAAPTLIDLAGLTGRDEEADGIHLLRAPGRRCLISRTGADAPLRFSVVDWPYKYVYFDRAAAADDPPTSYQGRWLIREGPAEEELYHLELDPGEQENLVDRLPDVAARLRAEMVRWLSSMEMPTRSDRGEAGVADEEMQERLRALGYIQ